MESNYINLELSSALPFAFLFGIETHYNRENFNFPHLYISSVSAET